MKTFITILTIIATLAVIVSCTVQKPSTTEITVLYDITDKQLAQPNADEILSFFSLQNKWEGELFRFKDLTDISYNQITQAKLEAKNEWLSNEMDRDKEIKNFKNNVSTILATSTKNATTKNNSSLYLPIANELNRLSTLQMQRRVLIIYSDLMENTDNLSFYRKQDFSLLTTNPNQVQVQLEKLAVINSLTGIEVWLIYQPIDTKSDRVFQVVSQFYKKLLESKGANVTISANLNP